MIEILDKTDIHKVHDKELKDYLIYSLNRLPNDFEYPEYGSFIIIENIDELKRNPIKFKTCELQSLENSLLDDIEIVEIKDDVIEIVFIIHNDFGVSLICKKEIFSTYELKKILEYSIS